jgi:hypothetical protein
MTGGDTWFPEAPDGHEWINPAATDCPNCPCHTRRVCEGKAWHRSMSRHEGCPCEKTAIAADTSPATRTVTITVAGVSRTVTAEAPTVGIGAGMLRTPRIFSATGGHLPQPVAVVMVLTAATTSTPDELLAVDEHGKRWQIRLTASHGGAEVSIQGWHAN